MPVPYLVLIAISVSALALLLLVRRDRRGWLSLLLAVAIGGAAWWVAGLRPGGPPLETKGAGDELDWSLVGLLYLSMLAGMAAQYFFVKPERSRFRWQSFLKPFLASPVVFIPLLASLEQARLDLSAFSLAKLMLLLASFQNGFFWKTVFDSHGNQDSK